MRINKSGNVGIGTASPAGALHIEGANNTLSEIRLVNTAATPDTQFVITPIYDVNRLAIRAMDSGGTLAGEIITFVSGSGNVGIGVAAPAQKLAVVGDSLSFGENNNKIYYFTTHNDNGYTSATEYLRIVNATGNWVWCVVEVMVICGFGSSSHYGKQKREYYVRILGDDGTNAVVMHTATLGTDAGAGEGVITLTTTLDTNNTIIFNVETDDARRCSVFSKVYAQNNQYLTITGA